MFYNFEKLIKSLEDTEILDYSEHQKKHLHNFIFEKYKTRNNFLKILKNIKISQKINSEEKYQGYFDGASKNNPGPASCGFLIKNKNKILIKEFFFLGKATNNIAEYSGISFLLLYAYLLGIKKITIFGDSLLIINQIKKKWKTKKNHLKGFVKYCQQMCRCFEQIEIIHVKRKFNKEADAMCNLAFKKKKNYLIN